MNQNFVMRFTGESAQMKDIPCSAFGFRLSHSDCLFRRCVRNYSKLLILITKEISLECESNRVAKYSQEAWPNVVKEW